MGRHAGARRTAAAFAGWFEVSSFGRRRTRAETLERAAAASAVRLTRAAFGAWVRSYEDLQLERAARAAENEDQLRLRLAQLEIR